MMRALWFLLRLPVTVGEGALVAIGRLIQAAGSFVVSLLCGAFFGYLVGLIPGNAHLGLVVGAWTGGVFGLLSFAAAVYVPFGPLQFLLWCLTGVALPLGILAATTATCFVLVALGVNPFIAGMLALVVAHPAFVALRDVLLSSPGPVARTVRGHGLEPYMQLKARLEGGRSAGRIWTEALQRHLDRMGH